MDGAGVGQAQPAPEATHGVPAEDIAQAVALLQVRNHAPKVLPGALQAGQGPRGRAVMGGGAA